MKQPNITAVLIATLLWAPYVTAQEAGPQPTIRQTIETIDRTDALVAERATAWDTGEPDAVAVLTTDTESAVVPAVSAGPVAPPVDVFINLPATVFAAPVENKDTETITIDFPMEDVRNIIRNVADLYDLNVVIPDSLVGSVSVKLRDVTWRQVFAVVLEPIAFTFQEEGNIIKIRSRADMESEPLETRVFIINFAKAAEIQGSVMPLIETATGGKLQVDVRSNALVITGRPTRMNRIQEIIDILDKPTEQVMIESKFVEVVGRDSRSLGVDWQSLSSYQIGAGPFGRNYSNVEGRTTSNRADASQTRSSTLDSTSDIRPSTISTSEANLRNMLWSGELLRTDSAVFSADAFNLVLSALERNNEVELISNPTVVTVNNTPAQINIGEEYPIPSFTYNKEQGVFEVSGFEYKPIGINLSVTPQINSAGFINLKIQPEISSRTGEVVFGGAAAATIPIITNRRTESTVTIKSGYTLAIGGLIEKTRENRDSRVPVLGSIPLVGGLFRSETKNTDSRNLIVFITAKILSASGATYRDVFSQRTLNEMGIKSRDLPGYEPPEVERELFDSVQASRDWIDQIQNEAQLRQQLQLLDKVQRKEEAKTAPQRNTPVRRRNQ
jgi:type IV pilus assembly protein PilQ